MVQIKVTPERLEQSAKIVLETKNRLEQIHKDLYNQTEYIASMWSGATSQRFYHMFNETKPQMFNVFREFDKIAEELMNAAEKFRNTDELYGGNLVEGTTSDEKIEEGAMCGKLPEKSTFEKIRDGIVEGAGEAVEDTIEGFKALGKWETWENMGNAALHPIDTLSTMYNVLSDSFINDVINGDAESRAKWGSYALTQVGLGLIGDKGLSKVSKVATTANLAKGVSVVTNSATYRNVINTLNNFKLNTGNRFAYAGVGGFSDIPKTSFNSLEEARNTFMFADPGNLNTPRFKEYLSQVEEITNRKIPENQRELLQEHLENNGYERLSKEEVAKRRREFGRLKDDLIEEWELETNQKWPTYEEEILSRRGIPLRHVDDPYDAHHLIENAHGGEHEWWNMHPAKYPNEHQGGIHGKEGISKEVFKKK
ncbi:WXG100 family type VII secretion target [Bacillus sp. XF8]|uniref:WXG100 family type VII secretion target n=1 Tax=Bacillus bingmayongensis TaxID=1150157 RepID=A0ABU5K1E3_9BACI|nr:WXG100 family type VII secretion target [Bacillus sp. XF8]MBO1582973.1 WXG100 family type VII secretion target [Bacillus sp. XF8]MDZ5609490.1 WXG100 family type VII secretion target [Bacillus pseudomycoides]